MAKINFDDRAVAFIDALGFKSLVNAAITDTKAHKKLERLEGQLSRLVTRFDKLVPKDIARLKPKYIHISDSIIISAPMQADGIGYYNGLSVVVMRSIQIIHHMLNEGYLLSGGIAVGKVWHEKANIIGPAYQDAFLVEQANKEPCIVLSKEAESTWVAEENRLRQFFGDTSNRMCIRNPAATINECIKVPPLIVNGLHDSYIPKRERHGEIEKRYKRYHRIIDKNLNSNLGASPKSKWAWFKKYLEAEESEGMKWAAR
jgi:hypothetical protein